MLKTCIVVADRGRARFFLSQAPPARRPSDPPRLVEFLDLMDLTGFEKDLDIEQLLSPAQQPPAQGIENVPAPRADDWEVEARREEGTLRFARRVSEAALEFIRTEHAQKTVLAAEPHMGALLSRELAGKVPESTALFEIAEELSWQTPEHIEDTLYRYGAWS